MNTAEDRVKAALDAAWRYGGVDGVHHKAWVIDRMVHILCGDDESYEAWVAEYEKPVTNDPYDYYKWDKGVGP